METMEQAVQIVLEGLDRVEKKLEHETWVGTVNTLLGLATPSLVLPSPAVGLMKFQTGMSQVLEEGALLRSVEPLSAEGEAILTPVNPGGTVHPWQGEDAEWIFAEAPERNRGADVTGLRFSLARDGRARVLPTSLTLLLQASHLAKWAFSRSRATSMGVRVPLRSYRMESVASPLAVSPLTAHLDSLTEGIVELDLPAPLLRGDRIEMEIRFPESLPPSTGSAPPNILANVMPVWNTVSRHYPAFADIEDAVSSPLERRFHVLGPGEPGSRWRPWRVNWVGGERSSGIHFLPAPSPLRGRDTGTPGESYRLAIVGVPTPTRGETPSALAVVLAMPASQRLKAGGQGLHVDFESTLGSKGNGLPPGSEFLATGSPIWSTSRGVRGKLVGSTWGGHDGFAEIEVNQVASLAPLLRVGEELSTSDVADLVEHYYGDTLKLVNTNDLLRREPLAWQLPIRVMFRDASLEEGHREVILESVSSFLTGLLGRQVGARVHAVESWEEVGSDASVMVR